MNTPTGLLAGKVALVSGVGPGLGFSASKALCASGAHVVLTGRTQATLDRAASAIEAEGFAGSVSVEVVDIADASQCETAVEHALDRHDGIDVLVNNAHRAATTASILDDDLGEWRAAMDVNYFGTLQMTGAVARCMVARRAGSIIFVSSMAMRETTEMLMPYAASKAATATAMRGIAKELGPYGIRANCIAPGYIDTEAIRAKLARSAELDGQTYAEARATLEGRAALRFVPTADDVAGPIVFLASDLSKAVTGVVLDVNAGQWIVA